MKCEGVKDDSVAPIVCVVKGGTTLPLSSIVHMREKTRCFFVWLDASSDVEKTASLIQWNRQSDATTV